jgi:hypothetical protein|tara:strand:- start:1045 stop:1668 length:624 start_codon:yes stop_codon:yes gene_type:complete
MPNHCDNSITIKGPSEKMQAMYTELQKEDANLCEIMYPMPKELEGTTSPSPDGSPDWYSWCTNNWGTKWGAYDGDYDIEDAGDGETIITGSFQSAWGPPTECYANYLDANDDVYIYATYYEGGMSFAGIWEDGSDDYYEFGDKTADEIEAELPEELSENYGIVEWARENEEPEELSTWMNEAVEAKKKVDSSDKDAILNTTTEEMAI